MTDKDPLDFFPKAMIFAIVVFGLLALVAVGSSNCSRTQLGIAEGPRDSG